MIFDRQAPRTRSLRMLAMIFASAVLVAGCSDGEGKAPADPNAPAGQAKPNGPMFAECAGITPQEIAQKLGVASAKIQFRNSVTCQWTVGGTKQASFTWYRGSPIGREESWEGTTRDAVQRIKIRDYPGFLIYQATQGQGLCELGADFGNDFIEWSVELGPRRSGQERCDETRQLAELSIDRAKK